MVNLFHSCLNLWYNCPRVLTHLFLSLDLKTMRKTQPIHLPHATSCVSASVLVIVSLQHIQEPHDVFVPVQLLCKAMSNPCGELVPMKRARMAVTSPLLHCNISEVLTGVDPSHFLFNSWMSTTEESPCCLILENEQPQIATVSSRTHPHALPTCAVEVALRL